MKVRYIRIIMAPKDATAPRQKMPTASFAWSKDANAGCQDPI